MFLHMEYKDYRQLTINGQTLHGADIIKYCKAQRREHFDRIAVFVNFWLQDNPVIVVCTSGSTGEPKMMQIEKDAMLMSAQMTASYFNFQKGQTALLCLPTDYIAGKMMVVRAFFSQLDLICVSPSSSPLASLQRDIEFAPMVPMQLQDKTNINKVKKILLGGAPISAAQEQALQGTTSEIYHGYGMTETLSHVAIRKVNGPERSDVYEALKGVTFATDSRQCLAIDAPFLEQTVQTNDVVSLLNKKSFLWKGRFDSVINSGGIKLFPEEIEHKLSALIPHNFFIGALPDEKLGHKVTLLVEKLLSEEELDELEKKIATRLSSFERPKEIICLEKFVWTENGKIQRKDTLDSIL